MGQREGRTTVYNNITSPEKLAQVNPENTYLENEFMDILASANKSKETIKQYRANLHVFWCWNLEYNNNMAFPKISKRHFVKWQNHCINELGWSPKRVRTVKATLSSLSNAIESYLDDEYPDFRSVIRKIESPPDETVRKKTILKMADFQPVLDRLVENKEYMKACVLAIALFSGRRKAELTRFKVSYFNDENLICGGALYKTPEKMQTKGRGKNGKLLDVYILAKQFKPYFDLWMEERARLGIESDWLFPKYQDGKWHDEKINTSLIDSYTRSFERILGKPIFPHLFRSIFVTHLLEQNLPEDVVQMIIGWSSKEMISHYDLRNNDSKLEKFFCEDGIRTVEQKTLSDL